MSPFLSRLAAMSGQIVVIAAIMASAIYYLALFNDGTELENKLKQVKIELNDQQSKVKESEAALKAVEVAKASYNAVMEQIKVAAAQIPSTIEQSEIISIIDRMSKKSGISVKSKEWRDVKKEGDLLEALPMRISAEGGFKEITRFFFELTSVQKVVTAGNFSIAGPKGNRSQGKSQLEMELKVYRFAGKRPEAGTR